MSMNRRGFLLFRTLTKDDERRATTERTNKQKRNRTELLEVLARPQKVDPDAVGEPKPGPQGGDRADDGEHRQDAGPVGRRGQRLGVDHRRE